MSKNLYKNVRKDGFEPVSTAAALFRSGLVVSARTSRCRIRRRAGLHENLLFGKTHLASSEANSPLRAAVYRFQIHVVTPNIVHDVDSAAR